jgi:hypothetical protein
MVDGYSDAPNAFKMSLAFEEVNIPFIVVWICCVVVPQAEFCK